MSLGIRRGHGCQVQAASSSDWGASVETVMEQYAANPNLSADDAEEIERARRELSERGELSAQEACSTFSLMAKAAVGQAA